MYNTSVNIQFQNDFNEFVININRFDCLSQLNLIKPVPFILISIQHTTRKKTQQHHPPFKRKWPIVNFVYITKFIPYNSTTETQIVIDMYYLKPLKKHSKHWKWKNLKMFRSKREHVLKQSIPGVFSFNCSDSKKKTISAIVAVSPVTPICLTAIAEL